MGHVAKRPGAERAAVWELRHGTAPIVVVSVADQLLVKELSGLRIGLHESVDGVACIVRPYAARAVPRFNVLCDVRTVPETLLPADGAANISGLVHLHVHPQCVLAREISVALGARMIFGIVVIPALLHAFDAPSVRSLAQLVVAEFIVIEIILALAAKGHD